MKDSAHPMQRNSDPRSIPFGDFCPTRPQQGFNVGPGHVGAYRLIENRLKGFLVSGIHIVNDIRF